MLLKIYGVVKIGFYMQDSNTNARPLQPLNDRSIQLRVKSDVDWRVDN